jgi:DNA-binding NtrC family response regulator
MGLAGVGRPARLLRPVPAMSLRDDHNPSDAAGDAGKPRLNLLLSYSGWDQATNPAEQLPRLLSPMGICSFIVSSGDEAAELISQRPIHIAVVDLGIPLQRANRTGPAGGARILQLLRRLDQPPPTVVIRPPQPTLRENQRTLREALREGAFAVLDMPLRMETMLETMRRVLSRHYADNWPGGASTN